MIGSFCDLGDYEVEKIVGVLVAFCQFVDILSFVWYTKNKKL